MSLYATSNQTAGPFLHLGLAWLVTDRIGRPGMLGERFTIQGRLLDGDGVGVNDGMIEVWQANARGKYAHPEDRQRKALEPGFQGFGRVATNARGAFRFSTIKPG
ncbi:MAG: protocatechuate 3,4-dioxygenase subunit alpha, partial [Burkholderiales bacterium]